MKRPRISKIQFVWNADFSLAGGIKALREVAGGYHTCTLCGIAYRRVRQKPEWKAYKRELAARIPLEIREPCRNQLKPAEMKAAAGEYPAVLAHTPKGVVKLLSAREIDACRGEVKPFRQRLDRAIDKLTQAPVDSARGGSRARAAAKPARRRVRKTRAA